MANVSTTARARLVQATTPTIYNLSMPVANTEYSQVLADGTKKITVRARTKAEIKIYFSSGSSEWITLKGGAVFSEENLDLSGVTIYLQSNVGSQMAEILEWV